MSHSCVIARKKSMLSVDHTLPATASKALHLLTDWFQQHHKQTQTSRWLLAVDDIAQTLSLTELDVCHAIQQLIEANIICVRPYWSARKKQRLQWFIWNKHVNSRISEKKKEAPYPLKPAQYVNRDDLFLRLRGLPRHTLRCALWFSQQAAALNQISWQLSIEEIAKTMQTSQTTIRRALRHLKRLQLLRIEKYADNPRFFRITYKYIWLGGQLR